MRGLTGSPKVFTMFETFWGALLFFTIYLFLFSVILCKETFSLIFWPSPRLPLSLAFWHSAVYTVGILIRSPLCTSRWPLYRTQCDEEEGKYWKMQKKRKIKTKTVDWLIWLEDNPSAKAHQQLNSTLSIHSLHPSPPILFIQTIGRLSSARSALLALDWGTASRFDSAIALPKRAKILINLLFYNWSPLAGCKWSCKFKRCLRQDEPGKVSKCNNFGLPLLSTNWTREGADF